MLNSFHTPKPFYKTLFFQARRKREETERAIQEKITKVPLKKNDGGSGGLNRSHSSPNIAKMLEDEDQVSVSGQANMPIPKFDRESKPVFNKSRNFAGTWGTSKKGLSLFVTNIRCRESQNFSMPNS